MAVVSEKLKKTALPVILLVLLFLGVFFFFNRKSDGVVSPQERVYFDLFDTVTYIYSYKGDTKEEFLSNAGEAYSVLERYHQLFDIYHEYEGMNNLCTINSNPLVDIPVDDEIITFLLYAREMYYLTHGEMNIMMGPVLSLWHDARMSDPPYLPLYEELEEAAKYTLWDYIEINEDERTVKLLSKSASIDVGAVAKGYAVERAAEALEKRGATGYVISCGGNIRIIGTKNDGSGWRTGIRDPENPDSNYIIMLNLEDTSCVTSGSYERYFILDGVRYSHIIDKDTLSSADFFLSVTIVTKDSALADALSTALFTMSYDEGALLASECSVDAIWVFPDGSVKYTDGIKSMIAEM